MLQVVVFVLLLFAGAGTPVWFLVLIAAVLGLRQGLANLANQNALCRQADPEPMDASAGPRRTF